MCLKALIRSLTSNRNGPGSPGIDLEVCLCCLNYDYSFLNSGLLMSSKWKCLSQGKYCFLHLVPGDTLNILIDMKLIFRRQESPRPLSHWQLWWEPLQDLSQRGWRRLPSFPSIPGVRGSTRLWSFTCSSKELSSFTCPYYCRGPSGVLGNTPLLYTWWKISYHCFTLLPILSIRETFRWRRPGNLLLRNRKNCNTGGRQRVHP